LIAELRSEYDRLAEQLRSAAAAASQGVQETRVVLTLEAKTVAEMGAAPSPYHGEEWTFELSADGTTSVPIGRSKAKKFSSGGVSMPKDNGVSTSHAKVRAQSLNLQCSFFNVLL
jgi:hypothetical protein